METILKLQTCVPVNDYLADLLQALQKQIEGTEELAEFRADELFDIHIGKTPPRKEPEWFSLDRAGNVIWMSIKDMGSGDVYLIDSSEYLTAEAVEKHNVKKCSPGSILLSFKLTIGRVGIAANEMVTNEAIACFSSDDSRKLAYLYPLLKSYDYASLGSTSSIATAVNSRMIKAMTIKMPSSAALDRYYAQTKPIYDLLLDNTREAAALAELRDALLPKLMSGELDVSEVELSTQLNNHLSLRAIEMSNLNDLLVFEVPALLREKVETKRKVHSISIRLIDCVLLNPDAFRHPSNTAPSYSGWQAKSGA